MKYLFWVCNYINNNYFILKSKLQKLLHITFKYITIITLKIYLPTLISQQIFLQQIIFITITLT